jgi:hypothetical protein
MKVNIDQIRWFSEADLNVKNDPGLIDPFDHKNLIAELPPGVRPLVLDISVRFSRDPVRHEDLV